MNSRSKRIRTKSFGEPKPKPPNGWEIVAQQVLDGKWNGSDDSTCEGLLIGLKGTGTPICKKAVEALCKLHKRKNPYEK